MSKLKKFIIIFVITIISIFCYCGKVEAIPSLSVGSTLSIGFARKTYNNYTLTNNTWLYCIDHTGGLSSNYTNNYTVRYIVNINGKDATCSNGKSNNNSYNAILAYILAVPTNSSGAAYSYGYGSSASNQTKKQKSVWAYWNTWVNNSGSSLGITASSWQQRASVSNTTLNTEATNWYNTSRVEASVSGSTTARETDGVMPYSITFSGTIKNIVFYDTNGNSYTASSTGSTAASGSIKFYSDSACSKTLYVKNIKSGQTFYVKESNTSWDLASMTINVDGSSYTQYNATLYLVNSSTGSQRLMAVTYSSTPVSSSDSLTVKISATESTGSLKFYKYGYYYSGTAKTQKTLNDARFIIKCTKNSKTYYLRLTVNNSSGSYNVGYTEERSSASTFITSAGKVTKAKTDSTTITIYNSQISGLKTDYTYSIIETQGADYYNTPIKIANATVSYGSASYKSYGTVKAGETKGGRTISITDSNTTVTGIKIDGNYITFVKIYDEPTSGSLTIEKYAETIDEVEDETNVSDDDEDDSSAENNNTSKSYLASGTFYDYHYTYSDRRNII